MTKFVCSNICIRLFKLLILPFMNNLTTENIKHSINSSFNTHLATKSDVYKYIADSILCKYNVDSIIHYIDTKEDIFPYDKKFAITPFHFIRNDVHEYYSLELKDDNMSYEDFIKSIDDVHVRCELLYKLIYFSINHLSSFCIICGKPLEEWINVNFYSPCTNKLCIYMYKEINFKNIVESMIKSNLVICDIKLNIYYNYIKSKLIINRLNQLDDDLIVFQTKFDITDIKNNNDIIKILNAINLNDVYDNKYTLTRTEKYLLLYVFTLYQLKLTTKVTIKDIIKHSSRLEFDFTNLNVEQLLNFSKILRDTCTKENIVTAYHGTNANILHNILKSGLLNMSNTSHETTGHVYGDGLYLGQIETAQGYSRPFIYNRNNSIINLMRYRPILVVNLSCPSKFYKEALNGIFVVPSKPLTQSPHIQIVSLYLE